MESKLPKSLFRLVFFLFSTLFFLPAFLKAEIIRLKNGNEIEATILKEDENTLMVQVPDGRVKIPKQDIEVIPRAQDAVSPDLVGK